VAAYKKKKIHSQDDYASIFAYLYCIPNADGTNPTLDEVAGMMGIDVVTASMSNYKKLAEKHGIFREVRQHRLSDEQLRQVKSVLFRQDSLENKLRSRFPSLNRLIVCKGTDTDPKLDDDQWDKSVRIWGEQLGSELFKLLRRYDDLLVGVGWGRTIANLVAGMGGYEESKNESNTSNSHREFFPIWGALYRPTFASPIVSTHQEYLATSSTALANDLHRLICGCDKKTLSIQGVPAILPVEWSQSDLIGGVRSSRRSRFLEDIAEFTAYENIFGLPERMKANRTAARIDEMNAAIVTVGAAAHPSRYFLKDCFLNYNESQISQFDKFVLGDIGGALLPRRKGGEASSSKAQTSLASLDAEEENFFDASRSSFTCASMSQLKGLAKRRESNDKILGVIAVVHGSPRAEAVIQALSMGLINVLCICNHLAMELDSRFD
jgi:DNA-binding transcriptional regulator LsrR (DeoR family)